MTDLSDRQDLMVCSRGFLDELVYFGPRLTELMERCHYPVEQRQSIWYLTRDLADELREINRKCAQEVGCGD